MCIVNEIIYHIQFITMVKIADLRYKQYGAMSLLHLISFLNHHRENLKINQSRCNTVVLEQQFHITWVRSCKKNLAGCTSCGHAVQTCGQSSTYFIIFNESFLKSFIWGCVCVHACVCLYHRDAANDVALHCVHLIPPTK